MFHSGEKIGWPANGGRPFLHRFCSVSDRLGLKQTQRHGRSERERGGVNQFVSLDLVDRIFRLTDWPQRLHWACRTHAS